MRRFARNGTQLAGLFAMVSITWAVPSMALPVATHTPLPGTNERRVIMDTLRPPVMKWFRSMGYPKKVIFQVRSLKVHGPWCYFAGGALKADGTPFDQDNMAGGIDALLGRKKGRWTVLYWGIASDVSVEPAIKKKFPQAPHDIYP